MSRATTRLITKNIVLKIMIACLVWFLLWLLVPGMHWTPLEWWISDRDLLILLETAVTVVVIVLAVYLTRRQVADIVGWSKISKAWWLLPLGFGLAVPLFYYHLDIPPYVYAAWMAVSVFWQQYLTFGLLQPYLTKLIGAKRGCGLVVVVFYLGHAIVLPGQFLPISPGGAIMAGFILVVGSVFAYLRQRNGHIGGNLILHWLFYFIAK